MFGGWIITCLLHFAASDESVHSITVNRIDLCDNDKAHYEAAKRRQRFHCLNGLRNAHCNGDDSEDEDVTRFDDSSVDDPGYLTEDCRTSHLTQSVHSTATLSDNAEECKPSRKLILAKAMLSVGKSFSIDSLSNYTLEANKTDKLNLVSPTAMNQISVDVESPVSEFEVNCEQDFPKLMAKSVSEEILNNLEAMSENMQTLSVNSHDDSNLDNLSSSSTSSLVILSKSGRAVDKAGKGNVTGNEQSQRLLPPEELGPNDAFMLFLCLIMLLEDRDRIIETKMDRNDIQMYFDNKIRKHDVRNVLNDGRHLFHTYLSQWHK